MPHCFSPEIQRPCRTCSLCFRDLRASPDKIRYEYLAEHISDKITSSMTGQDSLAFKLGPDGDGFRRGEHRES
jgi:hypothetical protein